MGRPLREYLFRCRAHRRDIQFAQQIMGYLARDKFAELEEVSEIFSLASDNKLFGEARNLHEVHVPDSGTSLDFVPTVNSRDYLIENHRPTHDLRIPANKCVGNHPADIVADDVNIFQFERETS
jgi:hypothetical protein